MENPLFSLQGDTVQGDGVPDTVMWQGVDINFYFLQSSLLSFVSDEIIIIIVIHCYHHQQYCNQITYHCYTPLLNKLGFRRPSPAKTLAGSSDGDQSGRINFSHSINEEFARSDWMGLSGGDQSRRISSLSLLWQNGLYLLIYLYQTYIRPTRDNERRWDSNTTQYSYPIP